MKETIDEVTKMLETDIKNRNIELTVNFGEGMPESIQSDKHKIKQVFMNLFMQIVNNQFRGFIKVNINHEMIDDKPFICIDIENSKFEVKAKDVQRMVKLSKEKIFANIIESKVDLNIKIAKVLSNALNWEVDFDAFRSGSLSLIIPVQKDPNAQKQIVEEDKPKDEQDLFNAIEGKREDVEVELPPKPETEPEEP
mmetsp:Transcript_30724/g.47111  ORF Transcript_30724/g.47111 Transcript_30724/m.47111 type:complete len:196 (+) Transcript_30724:1411-1998(+)